MFVEPNEIYTHLYPETIKVISGNDERLLIDALSTATSEVRGYLHAFDLDALFSKTGADRDALLVTRIKDIAVWYYIRVANPNVDYEAWERIYKYAISSLKDIQRGDFVPDFPPKKDDEGNLQNTGGMRIGSNPRRGQHI